MYHQNKQSVLLPRDTLPFFQFGSIYRDLYKPNFSIQVTDFWTIRLRSAVFYHFLCFSSDYKIKNNYDQKFRMYFCKSNVAGISKKSNNLWRKHMWQKKCTLNCKFLRLVILCKKFKKFLTLEFSIKYVQQLIDYYKRFLKALKSRHAVCFTDLDQGSEIISRFSLPKSMKHTVQMGWVATNYTHRHMSTAV